MNNKESHPYKNQNNYLQKAIEHDTLSLNSTLLLAYRDINKLLSKHLYEKITDNTIKMLDFGCGVGLSTQIYLQQIQRDTNFKVDVTAVDINEENIKIARKKLLNVNFKYILPEDKMLDFGKFDLIICNFVLVEMQQKDMLSVLRILNSKLSSRGILIVTNPTARAYRSENNWYTLNNKFTENKPIRISGEHQKLKFDEDQHIKVQVFAAKNNEQSFTFFDYFHSGSSYREHYNKAGLQLLETYKPKGSLEDKIEWQAEQDTPPYKLHVLGFNN